MGLAWRPLRRVIQLDVEVMAADPAGPGTLDLAFRGGLRLLIPGRTPFAALALADIDGGINRLMFGVSLGGLNRGIAVLDGARRNDSPVIDGISLTGLATRPLDTPAFAR